MLPRAWIVALCLASCAVSLSTILASGQRVERSPRAVIGTYCVTCHNQRLKTGGLALDTVNFDDIAGSAETLEKVVPPAT